MPEYGDSGLQNFHKKDGIFWKMLLFEKQVDRFDSIDYYLSGQFVKKPINQSAFSQINFSIISDIQAAALPLDFSITTNKG